jgi:hypothetical protein
MPRSSVTGRCDECDGPIVRAIVWHAEPETFCSLLCAARFVNIATYGTNADASRLLFKIWQEHYRGRYENR